jgi:ORF6N domain-containing protein
MSKKLNNEILIPTERISARIMLMREEKVMLDFHLAELYGIETRVLKQAVKRNIERFPSDFMFELNEDEINSMVSQNVIPSKGQLGGAEEGKKRLRDKKTKRQENKTKVKNGAKVTE